MNRNKIILSIKYIFAIILILVSNMLAGSFLDAFFCLIELVTVFFLSDVLISKSKWFCALNGLLMLIINIESAFLIFGGSHVTLTMIENINSLEDLSGKLALYSLATIMCIVLSCWPVDSILSKFYSKNILQLVTLIVVLFIAVSFGVITSRKTPAYGIKSLIVQVHDRKELNKLVSSFTDSGNDISSERINPNELMESVEEPTITDSNKPNVILILTEGISQNIIEDSRNVMPNVSALVPFSVSFSEYYNHTFATYRGIQGQLFSGHQLNDGDQNSLPGLQDILKKEGYHTVYLNSEPYNEDFSKYVSELHFDEVVTDLENCDGLADSITDKRMYELLWETVCDLNIEERPFMACMYTLGTHMSFDSPDERFGTGEYRLLNRAYNADYQFGTFLDKLRESELSRNTIIIFTSDHATFADSDFYDAYPDYDRFNSDCDRIPLIIYSENELVDEKYLGEWNATGRNSLDFAPTVLDILGFNSPDTFLGSSLFSNDIDATGTSLEHFFWDSAYMLRTDESSIRDVDEYEKWVVYEDIAKYFAIK